MLAEDAENPTGRRWGAAFLNYLGYCGAGVKINNPSCPDRVLNCK